MIIYICILNIIYIYTYYANFCSIVSAGLMTEVVTPVTPATVFRFCGQCVSLGMILQAETSLPLIDGFWARP